MLKFQNLKGFRHLRIKVKPSMDRKKSRINLSDWVQIVHGKLKNNDPSMVVDQFGKPLTDS